MDIIKLGQVFSSARDCRARFGRKVEEIVKAQPGYNPGGRGACYAFFRGEKGGIRLYKDVSGVWMDASLKDIGEENFWYMGGALDISDPADYLGSFQWSR